jgi:hypothetical protein
MCCDGLQLQQARPHRKPAQPVVHRLVPAPPPSLTERLSAA